MLWPGCWLICRSEVLQISSNSSCSCHLSGLCCCSASKLTSACTGCSCELTSQFLDSRCGHNRYSTAVTRALGTSLQTVFTTVRTVVNHKRPCVLPRHLTRSAVNDWSCTCPSCSHALRQLLQNLCDCRQRLAVYYSTFVSSVMRFREFHLITCTKLS